MKRLSILLLLLAAPFASAQEPTKHPRGFKMPSEKVIVERHTAALARHGNRAAGWPKQSDATFDITSKGWASPIDDQGQCGSCWLVSGKVNLESAYIKAGYGASWRFSNQYFMDCKASDPCNGGDEYDVFTWAKSDGAVTDSDYGVPYQAAPGRCKYTNQKKYLIADFMYVDPTSGNGKTSMQAIKNALPAQGMVSIALDASLFDNYNGGVMTTGQSIDHAVNIVGWDDSKQGFAQKKTPMDLPVLASTGAFKIQNQWGVSWGLQGFCWVSYNSYLVEGIVCTVSALPPIPPPQPVPPTPTPVPVPPATTLYGASVDAAGRIIFTPSRAPAQPTAYDAVVDPQTGNITLVPKTSKGAKPPVKDPLPPIVPLPKESSRIEERLDGHDKAIQGLANNQGLLVDKLAENSKAIQGLADGQGMIVQRLQSGALPKACVDMTADEFWHYQYRQQLNEVAAKARK